VALLDAAVSHAVSQVAGELNQSGTLFTNSNFLASRPRCLEADGNLLVGPRSQSARGHIGGDAYR